jgi:hypothetical protein
MLNKLKMLLLTLPLLSTMSCAPNTTGTVRAVSDYCLIAKGITFSRKQPTQVETADNKYDTDETTKQVEEHDLVYERLCSAAPHP